MSLTDKVHGVPGLEFTRKDLMSMDSVCLRALLRERTHHNIEVPLYPTLLKWKGKPIKSFGVEAQLVYDVWKERGLPDNEPDLNWAKEYLTIAEKIRTGNQFEWNRVLPVPFTEEEMKVVNKLIYERRSIRNFADKPVPDWMIQQILEAGRAAPIGCNLDELRFIVMRDPEEHKLIRSDISTQNSVIIVICYDMRIPKTVAHDKFVPQNPGYDAAAAADHMLLMIHALGLGGVWLSKLAKTDFTEDTGEKFRKAYGLPDYIKVALHIAVGWTVIGSIKSERMPLSEMMLEKGIS